MSWGARSLLAETATWRAVLGGGSRSALCWAEIGCPLEGASAGLPHVGRRRAATCLRRKFTLRLLATRLSVSASNPAIPASFRGEVSQERQSTLNLEEVDVLVSFECKREEGFPRKRQSIPRCRRPRAREHGVGWLKTPVEAYVLPTFFRQVVQGPPLILTDWGSTPARTRIRGVEGKEFTEWRRA